MVPEGCDFNSETVFVDHVWYTVLNHRPVNGQCTGAETLASPQNHLSACPSLPFPKLISHVQNISARLMGILDDLRSQ